MAQSEVDAYIEALDEPKRATLREMRARILALVPDAEQCISYGMPTFKVDGKALASVAAFKNHLSYFPNSGATFQRIPDVLAGYEFAKGTLKFPIDEPLPRELIAALIAARRADIAERGR